MFLFHNRVLQCLACYWGWSCQFVFVGSTVLLLLLLLSSNIILNVCYYLSVATSHVAIVVTSYRHFCYVDYSVRPFYPVPQHSSCHAMFRRMQAQVCERAATLGDMIKETGCALYRRTKVHTPKPLCNRSQIERTTALLVLHPRNRCTC
jgi:hypothetical protein